jgi:cob(I)alamin adenosyltransferase
MELELLTAKDVQNILKVSKNTLWRLRPEFAKRGEPSLRYVLVRGQVRYMESDVKKYLKRIAKR